MNLLKFNANNKILILILMLIAALVIFKVQTSNASSDSDIESLSVRIETSQQYLPFCKIQNISELTCTKMIKIMKFREAFAKKLDSFPLSLPIQHASEEEFDQYDISFCNNLNLYGEKCAVEVKRMKELLAILEERQKEINQIAL